MSTFKMLWRLARYRPWQYIADIVRGLAGEPKEVTFASRVAGSDGLTLTKEMDLSDLPQVCIDAFAALSSCPWNLRISVPVATSHKRRVWSSLHDRMRVPSGETAKDRLGSSWPTNRRTIVPLAIS